MLNNRLLTMATLLYFIHRAFNQSAMLSICLHNEIYYCEKRWCLSNNIVDLFIQFYKSISYSIPFVLANDVFRNLIRLLI